MSGIVNQGTAAINASFLTAHREALKTLVTHVGVSEDATAYSPTQTAIDPAGDVPAARAIKASSENNIDDVTFDAVATINGDTEMTGRAIRTVSVLNGALRTNIISRSVRSAPVGVQAGDVYTVVVRVTT